MVRAVIALALTLAGVLLVGGAVLAPRAAWAWELGALLGLLSALLVLVLCALPLGAGGRFAPPRLWPGLHRWLGWLAFVLALAHGVALLLVDPLVWRHLRPTLPGYELAAVLGAALLLVMALLAEAPVRRRSLPGRRPFRATHIALGVLALACCTVHVLTSGRYAVVPATLPAVRAATLALREPLLSGGAPLPLSFPHQRHAAINCIVCHHNLVDHSGMDTCLGCHRSGRADLRHGAEARLHDFCLACHRTRPRGAHHGPVAGCTACHHRESG